MSHKLLILLAALLGVAPHAVQAQLGSPFVVPDLSVIPCVSGYLGYQTNTPAGFYVCQGTTWAAAAGPPAALPAGLIGMVVSGTCPAGTTESAALNGKTLVGTLAANANVGTTGGADAITPAGTNAALTFTGGSGVVPAQTFTGSSANTSLVSAGTPAGTNGTGTVTPLGTIALGTLAVTAHTVVATKQGTAAGNVVTTATHALTGAPTLSGSSSVTSAQVFTGTALGTHQHTLTATGTNGTVNFTPTGSVTTPAFTGASFDNRSSFLRVIFCSAD